MGTVGVRSRWQAWPRWVRWPIVGVVALGTLGVAALAFLWATVSLPEDPPELQSAVVVAEDGRELAVLSQEGQRFLVDLADVNPVVVDALLSAEDRRFYDHGGVDPIGISRALVNNVRHAGTQGGSTLTQQLVKNEYLTSERSLWRKAREAVLSVKLERSADKDEILERYLNTVYFGRGAYGIEAAARAYFTTSAAELDLPQAALLVGLLRSPETADPVEDMDEARARRATVLADMVDNDAITQAEADAAEATPIEATDRTAPASPTDGLAPHFVEWVRQQTVEAVGEDALYGRGLRVVTTLDLDAQAAAEAAVAEVATDPAGPQAALVALDTDGAIRAHVGGRDYDTLAVDLVRGADGGGSGRQPGSTFKPFVLQAALEHGVTLADKYPGPPQIEVDVDGTAFPVENYGGAGFGELTVADATKQSVNTVYAQLLAQVGPAAVADAAHAAGVDADLDLVPSLALGVEEVSPLDLASAYLTFANDGTRVEPYAHRPHRGQRRERALGARPPRARGGRRRARRRPRRHRGAARRDRERHGHGGGPRPTRGRQDRHDPGQRGCLVRGLRPRLHGRGLDGPPATHPDGGGHRRRDARGDLAPLHDRGDGRPGAPGLPRSARRPPPAGPRCHVELDQLVEHRIDG